MAINGTAAQGGEQETEVTPNDVADFETRVERAVDLIEDGICTIEDVGAHELTDRTDEEFRAAVREELEGGEESDTPEQTEKDTGGQITSAREVDWDAFAREFGFHTPDANGRMEKSKTKVREAVAVSEQGIVGDPQAIIDEGVEMGALHEADATDEEGESIGYVFMGGSDNV